MTWLSPPPSVPPRTLLIGALATSLSLTACDATLGSFNPADTAAGSSPGNGRGSSGSGVIGKDDLPSSSARFRRLTHTEWSATVLDLLEVPATSAAGQEVLDAAAGFRSDPRQGGFLFESNGETLKVDSALWSSYQRAAGEIASLIATDQDQFDLLVPSGTTDEARAERFIREFGARAHRRPLSSEQQSAYLSLFEVGTSAYPDSTGLEGGIRLLLETFLQSPYFIYRAEVSDLTGDDFAPLDGFERASRLSYFFWGTMPDSELFDAAESGALDTTSGVREQARRLAQDARAEASVVQFFEKVLDTERYELISPASNVFPDAPSDLTELALEETRNFISGVIYEEDGGLRDLLTSTTTYVNQDLADLYGLSGRYGSNFEEVTLDPSERSGFLTQIGFLASHATSSEPDPIHRGVFVAKRMSCIKVSAPPDMVPPLPTPEGQSNRQLVEEHTEVGTCRNCHSTIINPLGFPFENYDAVGSYRTMDGEHEVDASAEVPVGESTTQVSNALELSQALAESTEVHECFSGHLVSFAQGRDATDEDEALIAQLGAASHGESASVLDLMVELATAVSFLNRPLD